MDDLPGPYPPDYLDVPHGKDCRCSHCKPDEHGPMPQHWMLLEGAENFTVREGWLYE